MKLELKKLLKDCPYLYRTTYLKNFRSTKSRYCHSSKKHVTKGKKTYRYWKVVDGLYCVFIVNVKIELDM